MAQCENAERQIFKFSIFKFSNLKNEIVGSFNKTCVIRKS
jgi:hypothetical protein